MSRRHRFGAWLAAYGVAMALRCIAGDAAADELVINGDFETDARDFDTWPGYVGNGGNPPDVPDWFGNGGRGINPVHPEDADTNPANVSLWLGGGNRGINPISNPGPDDDPAPFRDNGDNDTAVAFLQTSSYLEQNISGLSVGSNYTLSLDYNARDCCGDFPKPQVSLNGQVVADFPDPGMFPDGVVLPTGVDFPWYHADIPFRATTNDLTLLISTESDMGLDSTFLVDNVSLVPDAGGPDLIRNGDFEMDADLFIEWPGYVGDDARQAPFRDNGDNKTHVAFMQGDATLEQDVVGLEVGQDYVLSLDYNSRNCCGDFPVAELLLNDDFVDDFPDPDLFPDGTVEPTGGNNPWYHFEMTFTADDDTALLTVHSFPSAGGDATFVIDNVSIQQAVLGPIPLAGDADLNREFNQLDLVKVQIAGKYLTAQPATWGDGDWNGAPDPNSSFDAPPAGDGFFNQLDIIAALGAGTYLTGPYAAIRPGGQSNDDQTSIVYNATTGEVGVDAPAGTELTSINIDSASGVFTGEPAQNLGGSFDNDADNNIFKATFGGSFASMSFGKVAQAGLSEEFVLNDLSVVGSLAGGGALGDVDLIYVPEPATLALLLVGWWGLLTIRARRGKGG